MPGARTVPAARTVQRPWCSPMGPCLGLASVAGLLAGSPSQQSRIQRERLIPEDTHALYVRMPRIGQNVAFDRDDGRWHAQHRSLSVRVPRKRNEVEGCFGSGKRKDSLALIMARLPKGAKTSFLSLFVPGLTPFKGRAGFWLSQESRFSQALQQRRPILRTLGITFTQRV